MTRPGPSCVCKAGYSSTDCSIQSYEFEILKSKSSITLEQIYTRLMVKNTNFRINIEDDMYQFYNLLTSIEVIDYSGLKLINDLLQLAIDMPDSVYNTVNDYFSVSFFNSISRFLIRIKNEYRGLNSTIGYNENYEQRIKNLEQFSDTIMRSKEYLIKLSGRVTSSNPVLEFDTDAAIFKIERLKANDISGTTYTINSKNNYTVEFPNNFFSGSKVTTPSTVLKIITIVWKIPPKYPYISKDAFIISPVINLLFVDNYQMPITSTAKAFTITIPQAMTVPSPALSLPTDLPDCVLQTSSLGTKYCPTCASNWVMKLTCTSFGSFYVVDTQTKESSKNLTSSRSTIKGVGMKIYKKSENSFVTVLSVMVGLAFIQTVGHLALLQFE